MTSEGCARSISHEEHVRKQYVSQSGGGKSARGLAGQANPSVCTVLPYPPPNPLSLCFIFFNFLSTSLFTGTPTNVQINSSSKGMKQNFVIKVSRNFKPRLVINSFLVQAKGFLEELQNHMILVHEKQRNIGKTE